MAIIPLGIATTRTFKMVSNATLISGLSPTILFSRAGQAFKTPSGAIAGVANGWYKIALTAGDLDTPGDLSFYVTGAGADDTDWVDQVVSYNPYDSKAIGLTYLDTNMLSRLGTVNTAANFSALSINAAGRVDVGLFSGFAVDTGSTNRPTVNVDFVRSSSINLLKSGRVDADASAVAVTSGTVTDKTAYSLTQTFPTNFSSLSIDANGRILYGNTDNLLKNTAISAVPFMMISTGDHVSGITGLTVLAQRSIDGAAFGNAANAVAEVGSGWYKLNLAASDLNGNTVAFKFTAPGADQTNIGIITNI